MRRKFILLFVLSLIALLGVISPVLADKHYRGKLIVKEIKKKTVDAANVIKNYTVHKRNEAVKIVSASLNSVDNRFDAMEDRIDKNWDKMDKSAREEARRTLIILRRQRVRTAEKFGGLKYSSNEAWEFRKKSFLDSYKGLISAWTKAEKKY